MNTKGNEGQASDSTLNNQKEPPNQNYYEQLRLF
jgi:hypothetical protein